MAISKRKEPDNYSKKIIEKQMLEDLEHRISLNLGNYIVLTEEGDPQQIAMAHQKAKSEFIKFGPEMHKIAQHIGGSISDAVDAYLSSVDTLLHTSGWLDDDTISQCFDTTQRLESELKRKEF